jgi:hypothetical protein
MDFKKEKHEMNKTTPIFININEINSAGSRSAFTASLESAEIGLFSPILKSLNRYIIKKTNNVTPSIIIISDKNLLIEIFKS